MKTIEKLTAILKIIDSLNINLTDKVGTFRKFKKNIQDIIKNITFGIISEENINIDEISNNMNNLIFTNTSVISQSNKNGKFIKNRIINHQLNIDGRPQEIDSSNKGLIFFDKNNDIIDLSRNDFETPERGILVQKLWKIPINNGLYGNCIITDTSDPQLSSTTCSQLALVLADAPDSACELIDLSDITLNQFIEIFRNANSNTDNLRDISDLGLSNFSFENFGLISRNITDIDIFNDPSLQHLSNEQKNEMNNDLQIVGLNKDNLLEIAKKFGLWSYTLGPVPNHEYSDFKRFILADDIITCSMPLICYGNNQDILGIKRKNPSLESNFNNRLDDGKCYVVDMGNIDPVIRSGSPNPLPAHRFYNNGPEGAFDGQGCIHRYKGGQTFGINNTQGQVVLKTHFFDNILRDQNIPPMTALWKLHFGSHTFTENIGNNKIGGKAGYYTVFSASRPPPAGFMGVPFVTKHLRFGKGKDTICKGVTAANGVSETGKKFKKQDINGNLLDSNGNIVLSEQESDDCNLTGVTKAFDGHAMDLKKLLIKLVELNLEKGKDYFTIPANADEDTVEDILIPDNKLIPRITNSVATLWQFNNGVSVLDGGPNGFQPGIVPFLGGTGAYTPQWHINFIHYNCGVNSNSLCHNPAIDKNFSDWVMKNRNPSYAGPPPKPVSSSDPNYSIIGSQLSDIKYNPENPETFDPVQLDFGIKGAKCPDYICKHFKNSINSYIDINEIPPNGEVNDDNTLFITEAPAGAQQGWVKFLIVNCPLPIQIDFETVMDDNQISDTDMFFL